MATDPDHDVVRLIAILRDLSPQDCVEGLDGGKVRLTGVWDCRALLDRLRQECLRPCPVPATGRGDNAPPGTVAAGTTGRDDEAEASFDLPGRGAATIRIGQRYFPEAFVFETDIREALACGVPVVRFTPQGAMEPVVGVGDRPFSEKNGT